MRTLVNILWLVLAGWWLALAYALAGVLAILLVVTIPFGLQAFKLAGYALWPFGRAVVDRGESATGWSLVGNVVWLVLFGIELAVAHLIAAALLAVTIVGIPFAVASLKMAVLALWPFGRQVVAAADLDERASVVVEPPERRLERSRAPA